MTARISTLTLALVGVLLLPGTATAEQRATVQSPGSGSSVSAPVELRVQVTRDVLDEEVRRVAVRISRDGTSAAHDTTTVSLRCVSGCGTRDAVWGGVTFDPVSGSPFASRPVCNGRWVLQPSIDGGGFGAGTAVVLSAPGSPASGVRVSIDGADANLSWQGAPQPDIAEYRVERRSDGGSWQSVGTVPAGAERFTDRAVPRGSHDWRVVTLRPDGRSGGSPAAACSDTGADLATISSAASGRVTVSPAPSPTPQPSSRPATDGTDASSSGGGDGAADGGTSSGGTSQNRDGEGERAAGNASADADGEDPEQAEDAEAAPGPRRSGPRARVGAPPAARSRSLDLDTGLPSSGGAAPRQRYYGEGEEFAEEIDYADAPVVAAGEDGREAQSSGRWVPGGVEFLTQRSPDTMRALRSVAAGLVLLTFGLHLRRWLRSGDA